MKRYIFRGGIRTTSLVGLVTAFMFSLSISPANASSSSVTCTNGADTSTSFVTASLGIVASGEGANCVGEVTFDSTVTTIKTDAFYKASGNLVTKYTIPQTLTTIEDGAFSYLTRVLSFTVDSTNTNFMVLNDVLFNKDANGIATTILAYPGGKTTAYTGMPTTVTTISRYAFFGARTLPTLTIPASVTTIEYSAFFELDGTTDFFVDSSNLNFKDIDGVLFNKSGTTLINYPNGRVAGSYIIPNTVSTIGDAAFHSAHNSLATLTVPASVTSVESRGVYATDITTINFLGNAPTVALDSFEYLGVSETAMVTQCATGFPANGSQWLGTGANFLTIQVVNSSSCPSAAIATAPIIANAYEAISIGSVYFAPFSSKLSKTAKKQLAASIAANPNNLYKVVGHVQKSRISNNNAKLSLARAESVKTYLKTLGADVTFTVVVDAGKVPAKNGKSNKARRATLYAMTPVVQ